VSNGAKASSTDGLRNARRRAYDVLIMKLSTIAAAGIAAGLVTAALASASPAAADPGTDVNDLLTTLDGLGLGNISLGDLDLNGLDLNGVDLNGLDLNGLGLNGLGLGDLRPGDAAAISRELCPRLAEGGQDAADIAARVSEGVGRPIGPATLFTGSAISFLCPQAVDRVAGPSSITAQILGGRGI
jgi:hypothetical protein